MTTWQEEHRHAVLGALRFAGRAGVAYYELRSLIGTNAEPALNGLRASGYVIARVPGVNGAPIAILFDEPTELAS